MCQSKTTVSYRCSLYKITARNKPLLITRKLFLKVTQNMFLLFPLPWSALQGVQKDMLSGILLALGSSKGLHHCVLFKVSRETNCLFSATYVWRADLRRTLQSTTSRDCSPRVEGIGGGSKSTLKPIVLGCW